MVDSRLL
jgi:hypothetical protein